MSNGRAFRNGRQAKRVTPRKIKPKPPVLIATDEAGHRVELVGTPVDDAERVAAEQARKDAQMRLRGHIAGLWLPGDQL